ncbi:MAG: helix-hairpin-helix domain-containing protein [Bacteroidetes bacterium]|nr:helix-hairpin-helix domain-containing protein [Bacteroidota bacterium]
MKYKHVYNFLNSICCKVKLITILILVFKLNPIKADEQNNYFEIIEEIFQLQLQDESFEDLKDLLYDKLSNPIDLNDITETELRKLGILTDLQIINLFKHIKEYGYLISIYELQSILDFDNETIKLLKPFVKLKKKSKNSTIPKSKRNYLLFRYKPPLINNPKTIGSSDQIILKNKINIPETFKFNVIGKKDKEEKFIWDQSTRRYYFNSYSASIEFLNYRFLKSLVIGDFQFGCGQGLSSSSGYILNKSTDPFYLSKNQKGLVSHQSFNKKFIYRGLASTLNYKNIYLTILYSNLNFDANTKEYENKLYTITIPDDHNYINQNNLNKKDKVNEKVKGFSIIYKTNKNKINTGFNFLHQYFDPPLKNIKKRNDFDYILRGQDNINLSLFSKYYIKNCCFFGEWAISNTNKKNINFNETIASNVGCIITLNKYIDLGLSGRYYGPDFHSIRGNSLKQASEIKNEKGIYFTTKIKPKFNIIIDSFLDFFWFPYPKYTIAKPSSGIEFGSKIQFIINKKSLFEIKIKNKNKDKELTENSFKNIYKDNVFRSSFKYSYKILNNLTLKTEAYILKHDIKGNTNYSFMICEKIKYKFSDKLNINSGLSFFNAGSISEEKIYTYETKMLYEPSLIKDFKNLGQKAYLLLCYKFIKTLRLEIKYEIKRYQLDENLNDFKIINDLTLQFIWRY